MASRAFLILTIVCLLFSCKKDTTNYQVIVNVKAGSSYDHAFDIGFGLHITTNPQMAIWVEDTAGNYITTLFVTNKIAHQAWVNNSGNPRREALPHWSHKSGFADALDRAALADAATSSYAKPSDVIADAVTGATPVADYTVKYLPISEITSIRLVFEVNNSTDFNGYYTSGAKNGTEQYSGGSEGSGQPALVYWANINLNKKQQTYYLQLQGHSSADGSTGNVYPDLSNITSATSIVKSIRVDVK